MTSDTIFALSTAPGRSGVAIIRVSGEQAHPVATKLSGLTLEPRLATLATLRDEENEVLDESVLIYFKAPHSFTGEDVLEIHTHGSPAVVKAVLQALSRIEHCRAAEPGEFTRRAFLNGKMDLSQVEGLSDLLSSETEMQRRAALRETLGMSHALYSKWRAELVQAIAFIEALIDFSPEEDVPQTALEDGAKILGKLEAEIRAHIEKAHSMEILHDGLTVVLAGAPNVGKSSLLNALARRDAAIVTDEPGTTRDLIEVKLDLAGYPLTLVDTAGIHEARNMVEEEGIRRARQRAEHADLVLWLQAPDVKGQPQISSPAKTWQLASKADLQEATGAEISVSAKTGAGLTELVDRLTQFAREKFEYGNENALFMRERHRQQLVATSEQLSKVIADLETAPLEISAHELRIAIGPLERIMGFIGTEEMLGAIFARFCIGK